MTTIATLKAALGLDTADFDRSAGQVEKRARGLGASLNSALSMAGGFAMANVGMKAIGSAMNAVSGGIIGMNANLQKSTLQFETLMGSADQAREHVKMLFDFAKATPFESQPIIDASRMLQTFGGAALNTRENLTRIGDAAAATNSGINELGFWIGRAYSSIQAGRPFGEAAMRLQELAVLSPKARAEMEALQESGASASQVWAVMEKDLNRFQGAMKRQAGTWEGLTSTFSDTLGILSSTAFKPFFEMASGGLARMNDFLGRDEVTEWAERIADGVRIAIKAFGSLAGTVGSALGSVLSIVTTVGRAIYTALQWINPFARHSPSLVEQVQTGLETIAQAYAQLSPAIRGDLASTESAVRSFEDAVSSGAKRVADNTTAEMQKLIEAMGPGAFAAWRSATDQVAMLEADLGELSDRLNEAKGSLQAAEDELGRLEDAARQSKDQVKDLEDQLSGAERALRSFTTTPLQGSQAFSDQLFENEQQAKRLQLQLANMRASGAAKKDLEDLEKEIDKVRAAGEAIRLKEDLELGSQRRELEKLGNTAKEIGFAEAKAGALAAREQIAGLTPALEAAKRQQEAAEAAAAKQKAIVDEHGAGLEAIKARYDELKQSADMYQQSIEDVVKTARELEALNKAKAGADGAAAASPEDMMKAMGVGAVSPVAEQVKQVEDWAAAANEAVSNLESTLFAIQVQVGAFTHAFELLLDPERRQIGIDYFAGIFEGIWSSIQTLLPRVVGDMASAIGGWLDSVDWSATGTTLGGALAAVLTTAIEVLSGASDLAGKLLSVIRNWIGGIKWSEVGAWVAPKAIGFVIGIAGALFDLGMWAQVIADNWQTILGLLIGIAFAPAKLLGPIAGALSKIPLAGKLLEWMVREINKLGGQFLGGVGHILSDMGGAFVGGFLGRIAGKEGAGLLPQLRGLVQGAIGGIVDLGETFYLRGLYFMENMGKAIAQHGPLQIVQGIRGIFAQVDAFLAGVVKGIHAVGRNIVEGFWGGILSMAGFFLANVTGWIQTNLIGGVQTLLGIASPSTVFASFGEQVIQGLWQGITDTVATWTNNISTWIDTNVIGFVRSLLGIAAGENGNSPSTIFADFGTNLIQGLINGITGMLTSLQGALETVWTAIKSSVRGGVNAVIGLLNTLIDRWNSIRFDIPAIHFDPIVIAGRELWPGGDVGGWSISVPAVPRLPEIPELGTGGIATSPQLAVVGDVDEAIIPLAKLEAYIPALADGARDGGHQDKEEGPTVVNYNFRVDARESAITERELIRQAQRARMLHSMGGA